LCPWPCLGLGGYVLVNITDSYWVEVLKTHLSIGMYHWFAGKRFL